MRRKRDRKLESLNSVGGDEGETKGVLQSNICDSASKSILGPTCLLYASTCRRLGSVLVCTSSCHAASRGSIPGPGALLGVKTWLSTLKIVYLCVFRIRH